MAYDTEEQALTAQDWIWENWSSIFPRYFVKVDREHIVYGSMVSEGREYNGWRIDFLADYKGRRYIIEVDVNDSAKDIWHCFKVFGYRAAYCIDRFQHKDKIGVMVFVNSSVISSRVRNILAMSGIEYCGFSKQDDRWALTKKSLWRGL